MIDSASFGLAVVALRANRYRGQEDPVVVGEVGQHRKARLLEPEVVRRGEQRGVGAIGLQRGRRPLTSVPTGIHCTSRAPRPSVPSSATV